MTAMAEKHDQGRDDGGDDGESVERSRGRFRSLVAANPNYFGSFPDLGFEPVEPKAGDTAYEELDCIAYSTAHDRIEATILVKRSYGYSGGPCTPGSFEFVRFYVDYGGGWEDAGLAGVNVHDLPEGRDCTGERTHPLGYVCGVDHRPRRSWCARPVLPVVRAVLSWNLEPPPDQPDWTPPWGNVRECRVQIAPRRIFVRDVFEHVDLSEAKILDLPPAVVDAPASPDPDPGPLPPLGLQELAERYRAEKVPPHRFAMPALSSSAAVSAGSELPNLAVSAKAAGVDLGAVLDLLEEMSGDTSYEELECLGLNTALFGGSLVASFHVKQSSGYLGPPCFAGSREHVAFWADWEDDCSLSYLGTASVAVHDYRDVGDGLCYAAVLPVDLGSLRRDCDTPVLRRVRAVLSWNDPPSTTDPNEIPTWGNAIERHVQVPPGVVHDGNARFTIVGGVAADQVDLGTGLTLPGSVLGLATPLPAHCPFAGRVELHGPLDPTLVGRQYRIRATDVDAGGSVTLTSPFWAVTSGGSPSLVTPDPVDGWVPWPSWASNTTGVLGHLAPGGDDRWDFTLELDTPSNVVDTARVRMDNTVRSVAEITDTTNAGDLVLQTAGQCKVPHGLVNGTFVARDRHFGRWSISVIGGPGGPIPLPPTATGTAETPFGGTPFTLDLRDPMIPPCGYVVRLTITDRAIVNSSRLGNQAVVDRGLCLE
jgi:hypothetical protein